MARLREPEPVLVGGVPAELVDRDADVWHDAVAYRSYMARHGYLLDVGTRLDDLATGTRSRTSPERRRRAALDGWAVASGVVGRWPDVSDWHRLREMGIT